MRGCALVGYGKLAQEEGLPDFDFAALRAFGLELALCEQGNIHIS